MDSEAFASPELYLRSAVRSGPGRTEFRMELALGKKRVKKTCKKCLTNAPGYGILQTDQERRAKSHDEDHQRSIQHHHHHLDHPGQRGDHPAGQGHRQLGTRPVRAEDPQRQACPHKDHSLGAARLLSFWRGVVGRNAASLPWLQLRGKIRQKNVRKTLDKSSRMWYTHVRSREKERYTP